MKAFFRAFTFLFSVWLLGACVNEPDCLDQRITDVQFAFRKMFDGRADTVFISGIQIEGRPEIFWPNRLSAGVIMPMNPYGNEIRYFIEQASGTKQLDLTYNRRLQLITEDCGERILLEDVQIVAHNFDSVRVINLEQSNPVARVEIFRCPQPRDFRFIFRTFDANDNKISEQVLVESISANFIEEPILSNANIRAANLPLNLNDDVAAYYFEFPSGARDTLFISYNALQRNLFKVCGATTLYNQLDVVYSTFGETVVVRDSIREPAIINIEIFR
ncbi:MAG TPA: hypothetical protein PKC24_00070 [Cyclobacteriaceae bacterium]|nr:hypothetical protein [Cyclobacteriaceae bacterium]